MIQLMEDGQRNWWKRCAGKISGGSVSWSGIVSVLYIKSKKNPKLWGGLWLTYISAEFDAWCLLNPEKVWWDWFWNSIKLLGRTSLNELATIFVWSETYDFVGELFVSRGMIFDVSAAWDCRSRDAFLKFIFKSPWGTW